MRKEVSEEENGYQCQIEVKLNNFSRVLGEKTAKVYLGVNGREVRKLRQQVSISLFIYGSERKV